MITIGGRTLSSFNLIMQPGQSNPLLPKTRDRTIIIPGKHGAYDFGADLEPRYFEFPLCFYNLTSTADLQTWVRALAAHLTDVNGRPRTLELRFDEEPEKWYSARYAGSLGIQRLLSMGFFVLPMVAYDPFAYATATAYEEPIEYDTAATYDEGDYYINPTGFDWVSERHASGIHNYSYHSTSLALTITGTVTNPKITNEDTGEIFNLPDLNGDTLEIDGLMYKVIKNGVNALNETSGSFITLTSGDNSLIFEGSSPNCNVTYTWKHKFL